jgi:ferredoxin-NADP reductase
VAIAQKLGCWVTRIEDHGDRVYTIDLASERRFPSFKPGQFLHLALDAYDPADYWPESRVFSIASSPRQRDRLRLTYSVRGSFTARMERELKEEKRVWVKLPYGDFVIQNSGDVVLLAGGTGITAFVAYLSELSSDSTRKVYLAYGARKPELLIYRRLVDDCAASANQFKHWYFVEEAHGDLLPGGPEMKGKISLEKIWMDIDNPLASLFYLSGPPGMIRTLSTNLENRGIDKETILIDAWE